MSVINPLAAQAQAQAQQQAGAAGASGAIDTDSAKTKFASDLDSFLLMLTTQLQNQDPLSPMESNEFTQQLVGFAQVEQQIGINENLQEQLELQRNNMNTHALSYVGMYAEIRDNLVSLEDGRSKFAYSLASNAASTRLEFRDENNVLVRTMSGNVTQGNHVLTWDGLNDAGEPLPDGEYTVTLTAENGLGEPVESWTTVQARITGASTDGTEPYLTVNGAAIPLSEIVAVSESPTV